MPRIAAEGYIANPRNIKELFLYRLNKLASVYTRIARFQNERRFGVSMLDWRIIGLLAAFAPMSLNRVAQETNLDKGGASRSVAALIAGGFIERSLDEADGRAIKLMLTKKGKSMYQRLFSSAVLRNQALLQVSTPAERKGVEHVIYKLSERALAMLAEERSIAAKTPQAKRKRASRISGRAR